MKNRLENGDPLDTIITLYPILWVWIRVYGNEVIWSRLEYLKTDWNKSRNLMNKPTISNSNECAVSASALKVN